MKELSLGRKEKRPFWRRGVWVLMAALAVIVALCWFRVGPEPVVSIEPGLPAIGPSTPVKVTLEEPSRGLGDLKIELVQGERSALLMEESLESRAFWKFWGPRTQSRSYDLTLGPETLEGLEEGKATLVVTAGRASTWLRHPKPLRTQLELPVHLRPPSLDVLGGPYYATQGGSGLVVYQVGASSARDGVQSGKWWFPGYPLPGGNEGERFCLFGAPYDLEDGEAIRVLAADELGNEIDLPFLAQLEVKPLKTDTIPLDDGFLARVVPRIQAETPHLRPSGELLADYLEINRNLRKSNGEELMRLAEDTVPDFLWKGAFRQLPGSQVMSSFSDRRTYVYKGENVDQQDHLGFDLASTRQAPVPASNAGKVVLARYFGIYGRTVVLDHGYGLMSLYAHLSSLAVEEGQMVKLGEVLGRTGATGLAGGDHLHFTLLLHGLAVNPVEWWDGKWIERRVQASLNLSASSS